jgi:hypothetical protein
MVLWGAPGLSTSIEMADLTASVFLTTDRSFLPSFSLRNEVWKSVGVNVPGEFYYIAYVASHFYIENLNEYQ